MKIAIDGTQSVGKTTLFEALKDKLLGWNFIPELARTVAPQFNLESHKDWSELISNRKKYNSFIEIMIEQQQNKEKSTPFIIDSSIYRTIAYAHFNGLDICNEYIKKIHYDLIIFCPIEFDYIDDGFRYSNGREEVDTELRYLIKKNHRGNVVELAGSTQQRIDMVLETITY